MSFHGYFFNPDKNFNIQTRKKVYIKERLQNAQPVAGKWHVTKWAYEFRFIPLRLTYLVTHFRTLLKNLCKTRLHLNWKGRHFSAKHKEGLLMVLLFQHLIKTHPDLGQLKRRSMAPTVRAETDELKKPLWPEASSHLSLCRALKLQKNKLRRQLMMQRTSYLEPFHPCQMCG